MLYQNEYVWFVLVSALDVMLTWVILMLGGSEVNAIANSVLMRWGLKGLVVFKFALVVVVISVCEAVGRRRPEAGRRLARAAVAITCVPLVWAAMLLIAYG